MAREDMGHRVHAMNLLGMELIPPYIVIVVA